MTEHPLRLIPTGDGSQTILNMAIGSTYHSRHGALTESLHVFILQGLKRILEEKVTSITVLEMGLGTGLNVLLTALHTLDLNVNVQYHGIELCPIPENIWKAYRLPDELAHHEPLFHSLHRGPWNRRTAVTDRFELMKHRLSLLEYRPEEKFNLVYFDAFEPQVQPELWTEEVFRNLFSWMVPGGILTTYCCKGDVRRAMLKVGFRVERIPGPPGKREIIRATRPLGLDASSHGPDRP